MLKIIQKPSPNTDLQKIDVQFLILHYTALSLEKTLKIFQNPQKKVSAHFIIDKCGTIYEVISSLKPSPLKAFHAGKSTWIDEKNNKFSDFNQFSLGIELVNLNGNTFPYTEKQYKSLIELTLKLISLYPALKNPHRILGHEHIAGFRGKIDPGHQFDWSFYFKEVYSKNFPKRKPMLPLYLKERFDDLIQNLQEKEWDKLNTLLEQQYLHYQKTQTQKK